MLDVCGVPIGSGFFIMDRWWELGTDCRMPSVDMEDTEGGFAYERRVGDIGFQSSGWRASRTLAATFSGLPVLVSGEHAIIGRPDREIAIKDVVNEVVGFVREFETETAQTVFKSIGGRGHRPGNQQCCSCRTSRRPAPSLSIDTPVAGVRLHHQAQRRRHREPTTRTRITLHRQHRPVQRGGGGDDLPLAGRERSPTRCS